MPIDLTTKQQTSDKHLARQPQGLVPVIEIDGQLLTQSLAIIEYIDTLSQQVTLLPSSPLERAYVRSLSHIMQWTFTPSVM